MGSTVESSADRVSSVCISPLSMDSGNSPILGEKEQLAVQFPLAAPMLRLTARAASSQAEDSVHSQSSTQLEEEYTVAEIGSHTPAEAVRPDAYIKKQKPLAAVQREHSSLKHQLLFSEPGKTVKALRNMETESYGSAHHVIELEHRAAHHPSQEHHPLRVSQVLEQETLEEKLLTSKEEVDLTNMGSIKGLIDHEEGQDILADHQQQQGSPVWPDEVAHRVKPCPEVCREQQCDEKTEMDSLDHDDSAKPCEGKLSVVTSTADQADNPGGSEAVEPDMRSIIQNLEASSRETVPAVSVCTVRRPGSEVDLKDGIGAQDKGVPAQPLEVEKLESIPVSPAVAHGDVQVDVVHDGHGGIGWSVEQCTQRVSPHRPAQEAIQGDSEPAVHDGTIGSLEVGDGWVKAEVGHENHPPHPQFDLNGLGQQQLTVAGVSSPAAEMLKSVVESPHISHMKGHSISVYRLVEASSTSKEALANVSIDLIITVNPITCTNLFKMNTIQSQTEPACSHMSHNATGATRFLVDTGKLSSSVSLGSIAVHMFERVPEIETVLDKIIDHDAVPGVDLSSRVSSSTSPGTLSPATSVTKELVIQRSGSKSSASRDKSANKDEAPSGKTGTRFTGHNVFSNDPTNEASKLVSSFQQAVCSLPTSQQHDSTSQQAQAVCSLPPNQQLDSSFQQAVCSLPTSQQLDSASQQAVCSLPTSQQAVCSLQTSQQLDNAIKQAQAVCSLPPSQQLVSSIQQAVCSLPPSQQLDSVTQQGKSSFQLADYGLRLIYQRKQIHQQYQGNTSRTELRKESTCTLPRERQNIQQVASLEAFPKHEDDQPKGQLVLHQPKANRLHEAVPSRLSHCRNMTDTASTDQNKTGGCYKVTGILPVPHLSNLARDWQTDANTELYYYLERVFVVGGTDYYGMVMSAFFTKLISRNTTMPRVYDCAARDSVETAKPELPASRSTGMITLDEFSMEHILARTTTHDLANEQLKSCLITTLARGSTKNSKQYWITLELVTRNYSEQKLFSQSVQPVRQPGGGTCSRKQRTLVTQIEILPEDEVCQVDKQGDKAERPPVFGHLLNHVAIKHAEQELFHLLLDGESQ